MTGPNGFSQEFNGARKRKPHYPGHGHPPSRSATPLVSLEGLEGAARLRVLRYLSDPFDVR